MRIAIVTPRYGSLVAGGAERLARDYATRLAPRLGVTVLTTCALDYTTWANHFPAGATDEDRVHIVRFPVSETRDQRRFDGLSRTVLHGGHRADEEAWMDAQGPHAPGLLEHLRDHGGRYDAVLFVPYLYATTVRGLPHVRDRAVLIPALHDEPWLGLEIFRPVIESARAVVFSTPEERELALSRFAIDPERCVVVGAGVDRPPPFDPGAFAALTEQRRPYVICVGRIDPSKGARTLIDSHRALRKVAPDGPDLVMLGPAAMSIPSEPWLLAPGFVEEDVKNAAIAGADALICPSPYESLSLVLLEAWAHAIPTISASTSPVLVGQSRRSGGGIWYRDTAEYIESVQLIASTPALAAALGASGRRFTETLSWDAITTRLIGVVEAVAAQAGPGARVAAS